MLVKKSVEKFIAELASSAPTPGGGAAAALVGAVASALIEMVARLAQAHGDEVSELIARARMSREKLLSLMEEDARAYDAVVEAHRLPKEKRGKAVQTALKVAAEVPMNTASQAADVLTLAAELFPHCPKNTQSDLAVAARLAWAAAESALFNVDANCLAIKDAEFLAQMRAKHNQVFLTGVLYSHEVLRMLRPQLEKWLGERDSNPH